jgi:hypothetical protein
MFEKVKHLLTEVLNFYYDGFRNMTIGKKLWPLILIKLFIIFIVLKLFFFPDYLNTRFENDEQRSNYVLEQLTTQQTK